MATMPDTEIDTRRSEPQTPGLLLHYSIALTGIGTVFLGPLLPSLTTLLHLNDAGSGSLLASQFIGAFLGGWTTGAPLRRSMLRGYSAAILGYAALALICGTVHGAWAARIALAVLGFGIGQLLTSTNLVASRKWASTRGRSLTLLNFSWSAGALTTSLLLVRVLHRVGVVEVLSLMTLLLILGGSATLLATHKRPPAGLSTPTLTEPRARGLDGRSWAYFATLLFVYGGVETCLSEWLTTFDTRYETGSWAGNPLSQTAFWGTLTLARALAPALMLRVPERLLLRCGLIGATAALSLLIGGWLPTIICASLAGLSLATWFPLVLTAMVGEDARPRQVGQILAISGLGASAFQWAMGHLSEGLGSLREAVNLPLAGVALLLLLSFHRTSNLKLSH